MKKLLSLFAAAFVALSAPARIPTDIFGPASAQNSPKLEYNSYFQYFFDNKEFDSYHSEYSPIGAKPMESGTLNAMRITPNIGFSFFQNRNVNHRLEVGADVLKQMGKGGVTANFVVHYDVHVRLRDGAMFEGVLGVFPRRFCEGSYGPAFFDEAFAFMNNNLQGILLKYKRMNFYTEVWEDWFGLKSGDSRERFMFGSSGLWTPAGWLALGWEGTFMHYASSEVVAGTVDNNLLNPYLRFDLSRFSGMQELSLKLGGLFAYQRDRIVEDAPTVSPGAEAVLRIKKWNVCIANTFAYSDGLQRLYHKTDGGGNMYGGDLYFGSPFYQCKVFDMVELSWSPRISDCVCLYLGARFHFSEEGFMGTRQFFGFVFDLDKLRHPDWGSGRIGTAVRVKRRPDGPVFFM